MRFSSLINIVLKDRSPFALQFFARGENI